MTLIKKSGLILMVLMGFVTSMAYSQIVEPVKWDYKIIRINDTIAEMQFIASIDPGWHLYAQNLPKGGPNPIVFSFDEISGAALTGKVKEPEGHTDMDKMFKMKVKYFAINALFTQRIKIKPGKPVKVSGTLDYQACNDRSCLPGDSEFEFTLSGSK